MDLHLTWATETGHSLDLARQFRDACIAQNLPITSFASLGELTTFRAGIWVFFVSTTGQGSLPFAVRTLWKEMMKKNYKIEQNIKFAIYSLGDRSYGDNFALAARKLRQRMKMLGAEQLIDIGLGDDQDTQGFRQVYISGWRDNLLLRLRDLAKKGNANNQTFDFDWKAMNENECKIVNIQNLSDRKWRKVYWIELQLQTQAKEGDILQFFPFNRPEDVAYLLKYFQKTGGQIVEYLGLKLSLRQVLQKYCNVSSILNFYFFSAADRQNLVRSSSNSLHQQKIQQFGDNFQEYFNFFYTYKRNIIEFLQDFQVKFSLEYFLTHINPVLARKFTIAKVQAKRVWLLIKLIETKITEGRIFKGLCSHDLLNPAAKRACRVLPGDITPQQMRKNNIIVSLGTGIAPFIWMINRLAQSNSFGMLIYTNSYSDQMFHRTLCNFKEQNLQEVVSYTREGGLKLLRIIQNNMQKIDSLIKKEGIQNVRVFYCGPKQLHQYLQTCFSKLLNLSIQELNKKKLIVYQNW